MPIPAQQNPVVRTTARERVFKTLQTWIIDGTLLPEERLNDAELAKYFAVSRTPVREALQMLAEQKLVIMVPSSGTFVAPIDLEDMTYVYELLGMLQTNALDLWQPDSSAEQLDTLREINKTFGQYAEKGDACNTIDADREFHSHIAALSGNPYLVTYTDQLMAQAHRNEIRFFEIHTHFTQSYDTHNRIIDALEKKDRTTAKQLLLENWKISMGI